VGDARIFVDILNPAIAIENGAAVERPTMIFLHGGPGFDYLSLRPPFEPLADEARLIFYDHRGNGRSDHGDPSRWTLKQWARDLAMLIDTLGLDRPIVFGQSFGGIVAQQFALDFPGRYSGLVIASSLARFDLDAIVGNFERLHGREHAEIARQFFTRRTPGIEREYRSRCLPLYTVGRAPIGAVSIMNPLVSEHFFSIDGEGLSYDFSERLHEIAVPVLVLGGDRDPVVPVPNLRDMADRFAPGIADCVVLEHCGHGPGRDCPEPTLHILRHFIARVAAR
jgi:proline iminopeptidase